MGFLLEINQGDCRHIVGKFESEKNIFIFLDSITFVQKEQIGSHWKYFIEYKDIPDYFEAGYKGNVYVISRFAFPSKTETIEFAWNHLSDFENEKSMDAIIEGSTIIDGFFVDNKEIKGYIITREELYFECKRYYESMGFEVERGGYGSQDGEYVSVFSEDSNTGEGMFLILDPFAVDVWEKNRNFESFIDNYKNSLDELCNEKFIV